MFTPHQASAKISEILHSPHPFVCSNGVPGISGIAILGEGAVTSTDRRAARPFHSPRGGREDLPKSLCLLLLSCYCHARLHCLCVHGCISGSAWLGLVGPAVPWVVKTPVSHSFHKNVTHGFDHTPLIFWFRYLQCTRFPPSMIAPQCLENSEFSTKKIFPILEVLGKYICTTDIYQLHHI